MQFTLEAVLALSPDDASAKAARGLNSTSQWPTLGANAQAVWGECQGSGSKPYQTQVDLLAGPAFRCSCPSRKFPCKHGLALLLMRCNASSAFSATDAPAWVSGWLASRAEKAALSEQKVATRASAPASAPEALTKRQSSETKRWQTIQAGLEQLQLWMADHMERGIATLSPEQRASFQTTAARLVDAQAPGLAQRLKEAGDAIGKQPDWPVRVLHCFGNLQCIADAVARRGALPDPVLADLKATLGWPMDKAEVLDCGVLLEDDFTVLGSALQPRDAKVTERRVWLQGQRSGQRALLLEFSHGSGSGFEGVWGVGNSYALALRYYPSASLLRATVAEHRGITTQTKPLIPEADEWLALAQRFAQNPWLPLAPMVFAQATPVYQNSAWVLHIGHTAQTTLPLRINDENGWLLAAHSGGNPVALMGEWDGEQLTPLTAWGPDGLWLHGMLT